LILSVKVENWKSHENTELKFGEGTNILLGPNGGGKSSILEAVSFALFGTIPALRRRLVKQEDLIMNKPYRAEGAKVELRFRALDGREFTVRREIRRGSPSQAELREEGRLIAEGPERVTSYIQELLGMDYELYERAVYSEQDQLDLLLREKERKRRIDELLGIDKLEEARKKAGSLARALSLLAQKEKERLAGLEKERIGERLAKLAEEIRSHEERLSRVKEEEARVNRELKDKEEELRSLERVKEELAKMKEELESVRGSIRTLQVQHDRLRGELGSMAGVPLDQLREKVRLISAELEGVKRERQSKEEIYKRKWMEKEEKRAQITAHRSRAEQLARELERASEISKKLQEINLPRLEEELEKLRAKGERLLREKAEINAQTSELLKSLEQLKGASAQCPVCETPLEENRKTHLISEKNRRLGELQLRAGELEAEWRNNEAERRRKEELWREAQKLEVESRRAEELKKEWEGCLKKASELEKLLEEDTEELASLESEAKILRQREEETRNNLQLAQQTLYAAETLKTLETELVSAQARELLLNRAYAEKRKGFNEGRIEELRLETRKLTEEKGRLESELSGLQELLRREREQAEELERGRREMRRLEVELKVLQQAFEYFSKVQQALLKTQAVLREEFVEMVNDLMDRLWTRIYPYGDFNSLALRVQEGEYFFGLKDRGGRWVSLEGPVSGGEKAAACLAMRMAFSLALAPKLGWMILDEPTHNLDKNVIAEVAETLRERLPDEIKQVLLITHEEALEAAASGYLYRLTRDKSKDEPTKVELLSSPGFPTLSLGPEPS
jgi:exonuclease SbcC